MKYVSRPIEIEAMQWWAAGHPCELASYANEVVHWVNANGGEAVYHPQGDLPGPVIGIRTINGWAYAAPGHYVVMGSATFCAHDEYGQPDHRCDGSRDFYPCEPETFERRWSLAVPSEEQP